MAPKSEQPPPGGSSHGGQFETAAFATSVFGGRGDRESPFRRSHRASEERELYAQPPSMLMSAAVDFTLNKEQVRPSRLRAAFEEHSRTRQFTNLRPSHSTPDLSRHDEARTETASSPMLQRSPQLNNSTSFSSSRNEDMPEIDPMTLASKSLNTRWYPHVCSSRGTLRMSKPAAMTASIDPGKEADKSCPFWAGPKHRVVEARFTPERSLKWKSDVAWSDPTNHASWKITQTVPKGMAVTRSSSSGFQYGR